MIQINYTCVEVKNPQMYVALKKAYLKETAKYYAI